MKCLTCIHYAILGSKGNGFDTYNVLPLGSLTKVLKWSELLSNSSESHPSAIRIKSEECYESRFQNHKSFILHKSLRRKVRKHFNPKLFFIPKANTAQAVMWYFNPMLIPSWHCDGLHAHSTTAMCIYFGKIYTAQWCFTIHNNKTMSLS